MEGKKVKEIEAYMQNLVNQNKFNGTLLAAIGDEIILSKGYGWANVEHKVPNTSFTKFLITSITKTFTSVAIMQMIEKGMLRLDNTIADFITEYPNGDLISIHHLLSHTSGIYNFTESPDFMEWICKSCSLDEVISKFIDKELQFQPGDQFQYSNSNFVLLTSIIQLVSNRSYEDYLKENIFEPLGMNNIGIDNPRTINDNRATGYILENNLLQHSRFINIGNAYGAGCLYSTAEDIFKFDRALYSNKLITQSSKDVMLTPIQNGFAYGWIVGVEDDKAVNGHSGGIDGFTSMWIRYSDHQISVIALSNMTQHVDSFVREVAKLLH